MPGCVFMCSTEREIVVDFCEQKERGCISMIKRTVTNDCCPGEATWLSRQDLGQVHEDDARPPSWFDFTAQREMSDEGCEEEPQCNILYVTTFENLHVVRRYFKSLCEHVCTDTSNINGHVVAGEASLSQFLLGEEYRRESFFHCYNYRVAGKGTRLKLASRFHVL